MSRNSNARFLHVQRRRIEHDKWCEGIRLSRDPGKEFIHRWIQSYAGTFRDAWNHSLCHGCKHYRQCGLLVLRECDDYESYRNS